MNMRSFTFKLDDMQQQLLRQELKSPKYKPEIVPHTQIAVSIPDCRINLYNSGKLLIQGKAAQDWVTFTLETEITQRSKKSGTKICTIQKPSSPTWASMKAGKVIFSARW